MIVDCDSCVMKDVACSDCFVTFLLERPAQPGPVDLDDEAAGALQVLAEAALVPPLRLATAPGPAAPDEAADEEPLRRRAL